MVSKIFQSMAICACSLLVVSCVGNDEVGSTAAGPILNGGSKRLFEYSVSETAVVVGRQDHGQQPEDQVDARDDPEEDACTRQTDIAVGTHDKGDGGGAGQNQECEDGERDE